MVDLLAKVNMDDDMYEKYQNGEVDLRGVVFGNERIQPYQEIEFIDNDNYENLDYSPLPTSDSNEDESTSNSNAVIVAGLALLLGVGAKILYDKAKPKITNMIEEKQRPSQNALEIQQNFITALKFYVLEPNNPQAITELQYCVAKLKIDNKKDTKFLKKNLTEKINSLLLCFEKIDNKGMKKLKYEDKLDKLDQHLSQLQNKIEIINV